MHERSQRSRPSLALSSIIYSFEVDLADADRDVYESIALRVARHPSESDAYLVTRVLAYCLEFADGIAFSSGLSDPDEPPITVRDLTGALQAWVEIGTPDAGRVHKASKAAPRVAIYCHKDVDQLLQQWSGERIHRADDVALYAVDRSLVRAFSARLERRMSIAVSRTGSDVYVTVGPEMLLGTVQRVPMP